VRPAHRRHALRHRPDLNFAERKALVCGSMYAGEIKKTIFTVMNFLKPLDGVLAMHCSANVGFDLEDAGALLRPVGHGQDDAFGRSQAQAHRRRRARLVRPGIFNFEGGCYAKVIRLSADNEPQIHACTHRFGTILENVVHDPTTAGSTSTTTSSPRTPGRAIRSSSSTTRAEEGRVDTHPKNIILLTCDAQGVMPPIAKLTPEQVIYYFISGYTAKIAGTEIGLGIEPEIAFSACFGAPFMVHHPFVYADMLRAKMEATAPPAGWSTPAGPAGPSASASASRSSTRARCSTPPSRASWTRSSTARTTSSRSASRSPAPTSPTTCSTRA
jgi:phosphoenolpyruvate carboxykinase (ATP)